MVPQPSGCGCRDPRVAAATIFGSWLQSRSSGCGATAFGLWLSRQRFPRLSARGSCHSLRAVVPRPSGCGCRDPRVAAATIFGSWLLPQSSGCGATAFGLWLSRPPGCGRHDLRIVAPATVFGLWCHSLRTVAVATLGSRPPRSSDRGSCHSLRVVVPQPSDCGCRDPPSRGRHELRIVAPATVFGLWCHSLRAVHSLRGCGATVLGLRLSRPSGRGCHDLRIVASATVSGLWCHRDLRVVAPATGFAVPVASGRGSHDLRVAAVP